MVSEIPESGSLQKTMVAKKGNRAYQLAQYLHVITVQYRTGILTVSIIFAGKAQRAEMRCHVIQSSRSSVRHAHQGSYTRQVAGSNKYMSRTYWRLTCCCLHFSLTDGLANTGRWCRNEARLGRDDQGTLNNWADEDSVR
jgi:hypothetical protein